MENGALIGYSLHRINIRMIRMTAGCTGAAKCTEKR